MFFVQPTFILPFKAARFDSFRYDFNGIRSRFIEPKRHGVRYPLAIFVSGMFPIGPKQHDVTSSLMFLFPKNI